MTSSPLPVCGKLRNMHRKRSWCHQKWLPEAKVSPSPQRGSKNTPHVLNNIIYDPAACMAHHNLGKVLQAFNRRPPSAKQHLDIWSERTWSAGIKNHPRLFGCPHHDWISTLRESKAILWRNLSGDKFTSVMSFFRMSSWKSLRSTWMVERGRMANCAYLWQWPNYDLTIWSAEKLRRLN